jgi:hypothetical protein
MTLDQTVSVKNKQIIPLTKDTLWVASFNNDLT